MEFVWIEPGAFVMGTTEEQEDLLRGRGQWTEGRESLGFLDPAYGDAKEDEQPAHQVSLTRGYYIGRLEITRAQWEAVMKTPPGLGNGPPREIPMGQCPSCSASSITWRDVQAFIHALNEAAGDSLYRLPTEAEWEYAARAGTTTLWSFGDDPELLAEHAWWFDNHQSWALGEGGLKQPNPWGLYDMHGNAMEWVQDWYGSYAANLAVDPEQTTAPTEPSWRTSHRIVRGGSIQHWPDWTRSAFRMGLPWWTHSEWLGARLVRMDRPATALTPQTWGQVKAQQQHRPAERGP